MGKTKRAEWLLRTVMSRVRAEGIVGDLMEGATGRAQFRWAVLRVWVRFLWWPAVAFVLALVVGAAGCVEMGFWAAHRFWTGPVQDAPHLFLAQRLCWLALPLWTMALYSVLRHGWRDRVALVSALYAVGVTGWTFSLGEPRLRVLCWGWVVLASTVTLWSGAGRRAGAASALAVLFGLGLQGMAWEMSRWIPVPGVAVLAALGVATMSAPLTPAAYGLWLRGERASEPAKR